MSNRTISNYGFAGAAMLAAFSACVVAHAADSPSLEAFSVFNTSGMQRVVHGQRRSLDLSAGDVPLGHAQAFFGVDDSSTSTRRYLTSGLEWQAGPSTGPLDLSVSGMHLASQGAVTGAQTLLQATSNFDLGGGAFVPDLSFMTAEVQDSLLGQAATSARTGRFGLADEGALGGYRLGYFATTPGFDTWSGAAASAGRGLELETHYNAERGWIVQNTLRLHGDAGQAGVADTFTISGRYSQPGTGQPWALTGRVGARQIPGAGERPLSLHLASRSRYWADWRVDTALGWYQGDVANPENRPIDGGLWSLSFNRGLEIGGFTTQLTPRLAFGGTSRIDRDYAGLAGIGFVFPSLGDQFTVNMDYATAGWVPVSHDGGDLRLSLNFVKDTGQIFSPLRSLVDRF